MKNYYFKWLCLILFSGMASAAYSQCATPVPAPTVSGATIAPCASSSDFTLTANSSTNTTYWFSASGGIVSTNSVFVTPVLTSGASYSVGQGTGVSTQSIALPPYSYGYTGYTRGLTFTAPASFIITGVRVPTEMGTGNSSIYIMRFPSALPNYPTTTSAYTTLFSVMNTPGTGIIPVSIPVNAGDVIGILGCRDAGGISSTSYGTATSPYATTLGAYALNLERLGMQYDMLTTNPPIDMWTEAGGTVGRIEVYTTIGCISPLTPVTVTVTPAPQINITAPTSSICANSSFTLNASGVSSYTWTGGPQTSSFVVSPGANTIYTVSGSISPTCGSTSTVAVNVNSGVPVLTVTGNPSTTSVCLGGTLSLLAQGAATYTLSTNLANGATFTPAVSTSYTISGTNGCGTTTTIVPITVAPLPLSVVPSSTLICASTPATLQVNGASSVTWTPGLINNSVIIVNPAATTVYTINGQTGSCVGNTTFTLTTKPNPNISITASSPMVCAGDAVNLTVSGDAVSYTWSPNGQQGTTITENPTGLTLYSATGTNSVNCVSTAQQVIIVNPLPVVNVSASQMLICSTDPSTLSASGASTYVWAGGPGSTTSTMVVNPVTDATYTVTGTNSMSCSSSTVITINIYAPTISVSNNTAICLGGNAAIGSGPADSYQWSNGGTTQNITVAPATTTVYVLTAMVNNLNGLSCPASNSVEVTVNPLPAISATSTQSVICFGNSAVLTATGAGAGGTYTWTGGSSAMIGASNTVAPIFDQTYTVTGTDANGCKNKFVYTLKVSNCVGIAENAVNNAKLSIYPNPNNGEFTISSDKVITLQVSNELGQQVREIRLDKSSIEVNLNDLANGVYFITGKNQNGLMRQKIIISK